ncbi:MAG: TIGR01777 family oxidoreductase [Bacteroidota bacterium]|nr:TIGR01777 family oxidoreductase [Bacteroidota bacterium]MDP4211243.1 TIGR01777 family oxidoreductase [Bacteroidota bacterium]MDP4250437.1 TIGR01777 family oxidoreductase [Bacteroidota bacterium]
MSSVIITGGTGLVGKALSKRLVLQGFSVIILSRDPAAHRSLSPSITYAAWNINDQSINEEAVNNAKYIIHLAGAGVADKRWTEKRKREIRDSRIKSSQLLVKALTQIPNQVEAVVSASAIGWYRESSGGQAVETDPPDSGFLGETCRLWEEHIQPVTALGKRLVILRSGIVLSNDGGAFPEFKKPVKLGIAAILGNGKQIISWIHLDDLCRIYLEAMINLKWTGIYNAVAPQPVTNKTFMIELGKRIKGNFYIPFPVSGFLLHSLLGEKSIEVLKSSNVSCDKIKKQGFQFIYPTLGSAFSDLLRR